MKINYSNDRKIETVRVGRLSFGAVFKMPGISGPPYYLISRGTTSPVAGTNISDGTLIDLTLDDQVIPVPNAEFFPNEN